MDFFRNFVQILTLALSGAIFVRAILSWFPMNPGNPLITMLDQITEPVLAPLRRIVPRIGMLDITPLVAIILLQLLSRLVTGSI